MKGQKFRSIFLSLLSLILVLLFLEAAVRTYDLLQGKGFFTADRNLLAEPMKKIVPFRTFGFDPYVIVGDNTLISDRWGRQFPLKKAAGTYRIVCFGGSTTEDLVEGHHYPELLQEELRQRAQTEKIEVINVGNSAYATPHSIILLAIDVISWQPDLVILSHNINDLLVLYWPGFRPDYWNKYRNEFYTLPDLSARYTWSNVVFQHSRLYWFLHARLDSIRQKRALENPVIRRRSYNEKKFQQAAGVFERNLKTFITIAQANDIGVILGTQPLEPTEEYFNRHIAYKPYNDIVLYPPHNQFLKHHADYNRIIREVAHEMKVDLVDNESIFGGNRIYFIDYVHYTKAGIQKLADNYTAAIIGKHITAAKAGSGR